MTDDAQVEVVDAPAAAEEDEVIISADRMKAHIRIGSFERDVVGHVREIITLLYAEGIVDEPDSKVIRKAIVARSQAGHATKPTLVAKGLPPKRGADGVIEWLVDAPAETRCGGYVTIGTALLRLTEPGLGEPGRDVLGAEVPASEGGRADFTPGHFVEQASNGHTWVATCDGRVAMDDGKVSIAAVNVVEGDVKPSARVREISGCLAVQGSVLDGAELAVQRDLSIAGNVGRAVIKCGGTLKVNGSVGGGAEIFASGTITAKSLEGAEVKSWGNVVAKDIRNSTIEARGSVDCSGGEVCGGRIQCARLTAARIGGGVVITSGSKFPPSKVVMELDKSIVRLKRSRRDLEQKIDEIQASTKGAEEARAAAAERCKSMLPEIIRRLKHLKVKRNRAAQMPPQRQKKTVVVEEELMRGVEIRAEGTAWKSTTELKGPIEV